MTCAGPACAIASGSAGWRWLMCSFAATYLASLSAPGLYCTTDSAAASEPVPVTLLPIWNPIALSLPAVSRARFGIVVPLTTVTVTFDGSIAGALPALSFFDDGFFGAGPRSDELPAFALFLELLSLLASCVMPYAAPPPSTSTPATMIA